MKPRVESALRWLGERLDEPGVSALERYADWLRDEGVAGGGLGPGEAQRVEDRHIADSLVFACGIRPSAGSVLDIGTGVGLPGIPLAILRPQTQFVLLDRSGRRSDLAARAARVLGLKNVSVIKREIAEWGHTHDGVVMRAALAPEFLLRDAKKLLVPGGTAVVGLRRGPSRPETIELDAAAAEALTVEVIEVPVLDSPAWLLRIIRNV